MDDSWRGEMRKMMVNLFKRDHVKSFLDLGCGYGKDLKYFRDNMESGKEVQFTGIDKLENFVAEARKNNADAAMEFYVMNAAEGLGFENEKFDVVYSMNVLECISDKVKIVKEIHRVLAPGGQVVCCHCDWDSMVFNGEDKDLIKNVLHKYSNWKQPWMDDVDSWIGRRLWGLFNSTSLFSGEIRIFNLIETKYDDSTKGYDLVKEIGYMVEAGVITKDEYDRFVLDIETTLKRGQFLYVRPIYIYSGIKL